MKKIIMLVAFSVTTFAFSQKSSKEYKFFDNSKDNSEESSETAKAPGGNGDPAPIDDYIPALAVVALGMAVYFKRKQLAIAK